MTRIEKIDVDGFKGLTDTSLEFGGINVITGRNNTGKTSLQEAIGLGLDPERLEGYGDQVDDLINIHSESYDIDLLLSNSQYSLSVKFTPPEEALEHAIDALAMLFSSGTLWGVPEDMELSKATERALRTELSNAKTEEVPNIKRYVLHILYNDEVFRLFNIERLSPLISDRHNKIKESLQSEIEFDQWQEMTPYEDVMEYLWGRVPARIANFYPDVPEGPDDVLYVEQPKIDEHPNIDDEEGAAIKKVEIRDYLNEHEITPEPGVTVEDFDFDVIVFEEDGERYEVPYDFMGDGFKTIVGILWQFLGEEEISDVVLMEEPENNMHPGYVSELVPFLIKMAREEDVQLFLTTHNVDFISEFFAEFPEETQEYLESEFRLIQMTETVPKTFDYDAAKEQVEDLHLDLRGI